MVQRASPIAETSTGGPVRMCIGCRKRELAVELFRVVAGSTGNGHPAVTVDASGSHPGRGAWLHPTDRCLTAAIRRQAFARALRITGSPDISAVDEHVAVLARPARETSIGRT